MKFRKIIGLISVFLGIVAIVFSAGVAYPSLRLVRDRESFVATMELLPAQVVSALSTAARGQDSEYSPYEMYSDVLATVKANYYGKNIDTTQMTYNAIRGMMHSLNDRYTRFMDPDAYKDMMDDNKGVFAGIGAELETNAQEQVYIVRVLHNSPAMRAKVMAGDIIIKVDNVSVVKMKDVDVVKLIRGTPGTKVVLTLMRKNIAHPILKPIIRDIVQQEVVESKMIDPANKIGYIALSVFNEESDIQIDRALTELQASGMKGLILDLRENPGGLLDIAQRVASRFIPGGPVVWIKDRNTPMQSLDSDPSLHANHLHFPLVVLVNGDSASAAEIVSGAIKDTNSGILVGERTFGKGLVQTIMALPDGSAIAITTQHYFTAKKHDINHKGIEPDITVKYSDDDTRKMYAYMRDNPDAIYDLQHDRQLQVAVNQLKQRMRIASVRPW